MAKISTEKINQAISDLNKYYFLGMEQVKVESFNNDDSLRISIKLPFIGDFTMRIGQKILVHPFGSYDLYKKIQAYAIELFQGDVVKEMLKGKNLQWILEKEKERLDSFLKLRTGTDFSEIERFKSLFNFLDAVNTKPKTSPVKDSKSAMELADKYREYEERKAFKDSLKPYLAEFKKYKYDRIKELIWKETGLDQIPKKYRDNVYQFAYQKGHSSGMNEICNYLYDLVNIFEVKKGDNTLYEDVEIS